MIIDHNSAKGQGIADTMELHRIEDVFVKADLEKRGFKLIKQSDILRNENDDLKISVFDPKERRNTNRSSIGRKNSQNWQIIFHQGTNVEQ